MGKAQRFQKHIILHTVKIHPEATQLNHIEMRCVSTFVFTTSRENIMRMQGVSIQKFYRSDSCSYKNFNDFWLMIKLPSNQMLLIFIRSWTVHQIMKKTLEVSSEYISTIISFSASFNWTLIRIILNWCEILNVILPNVGSVWIKLIQT